MVFARFILQSTKNTRGNYCRSTMFGHVQCHSDCFSGRVGPGAACRCTCRKPWAMLICEQDLADGKATILQTSNFCQGLSYQNPGGSMPWTSCAGRPAQCTDPSGAVATVLVDIHPHAAQVDGSAFTVLGLRARRLMNASFQMHPRGVDVLSSCHG